MSGAIHPLPRYAFMAWSLVKAQGELYIYLYQSAAERRAIIKTKLIQTLYLQNYKNTVCGREKGDYNSNTVIV